ncbi:unnamed protein product [Fraxinus pennsylvanica]|uniref:3'-5' exonuclease domain-containing protein n=1 Tax=Fraxinus pennsylvanica TaxID=56036 RepID=A0AAD2DKY8_9LAMI|nr:unnamed protein product [Fraxinus pennsylvanica]
MAGTVFLKTNCFEVKLEGITFKSKDFEALCMMDFLFPEGKIWDRPPVVGIDVVCHPRDPSVLLILLCFGVGCVILRFRLGDELPASILKFLADERIRFVGFGIPEKKDLFPFEELGLTKSKVDIGHLAAEILKDPKYKRRELADLARKVLGIRRMTGLTEASSFERHEHIKCAICQLFITSIIAMGLLGANDRKKLKDSASPKKRSFLKNLNSLSLFKEGWFKLPKVKKEKHKCQVEEDDEYIRVEIRETEDMFGDINVPVKTKNEEDPFSNFLINAKVVEDASNSKVKEESSSNDLVHEEGRKGILGDYSRKDIICTSKKPLKGILKCPSSGLLRSFSSSLLEPESVLSISEEQNTRGALKRANSKGCNVTFKCLLERVVRDLLQQTFGRSNAEDKIVLCRMLIHQVDPSSLVSVSDLMP